MRSVRLAFIAILVSACTGASTSATTQPATTQPATTTAPTSSLPVVVVPTTAALLEVPAQQLTWGLCDEKLTKALSAEQAAAVDCTTMAVPLDYRTPDGPKLQLGLTRRRATGTDRIGSLLVNPGGPGGSGRELAVSMSGTRLDRISILADRFDIIGFDPRGVGASNAIECIDGPALDKIYALDSSPETPEERSELKAADEAGDNACVAKFGASLLAQINNENTARDMDEIRKSVGDAKLTYLGISYGTYLGATYATLFPDRVRALVLDGAYDPTGQDDLTQSEIQLKGFEGAFTKWLAWCDAHITCAFGTGGEVDRRWTELRVQLDDKAAEGSSGRSANQGVFMAATTISLYDREFSWVALGAALRAAASDGNGDLLLRLADSLHGRHDDGTYDTRVQVSGVIRCASGMFGAPPTDKASAVARLQAASPHFAFDVAEDDFNEPCKILPKGRSLTKFSYSGTGPILVTGGTNDPATPFVWAEKMTKALGPRASLMAYDGEGHAAVLSSPCAADIATRLLIELVPPAAAARCAAPTPTTNTLPEWFESTPQPVAIADVDIGDLLPFFQLGDKQVTARISLSTNGGQTSFDRLDAAFRNGGWTRTTHKELPAYRKKVGGQDRIVIAMVYDVSALDKSPFLAQVAVGLRTIGSSLIILGAPT